VFTTETSIRGRVSGPRYQVACEDRTASRRIQGLMATGTCACAPCIPQSRDVDNAVPQDATTPVQLRLLFGTELALDGSG
jgi:hypothetical protein